MQKAIRVKAVASNRVTLLTCGHQFRTGSMVSLPEVGVVAFCPICSPMERRVVADDDAGQANTIETASILSQRTGRGMVQLQVNGQMVQLEIEKAREVLAMLSGAIEAAISDELLFRFLTERLDIDRERASSVLMDFREMRQGSRDTVFPH